MSTPRRCGKRANRDILSTIRKRCGISRQCQKDAGLKCSVVATFKKHFFAEPSKRTNCLLKMRDLCEEFQ